MPASIAPNVPNASALKSVPFDSSYANMTSGQWTIGAKTNRNVCAPVSSASLSLTTILLISAVSGKKFASIWKVFAFPTSVRSGYMAATVAICEQWSGSMCRITR